MTALGAETRTAVGKTATPVAVSQASAATMNFNLNMEYCSVDLDNRSSNLNVRTWEGRVIGKLRHGTRVWVTQYSGEWARVSVRRGRRWVAVGWVDSTYLVC